MKLSKIYLILLAALGVASIQGDNCAPTSCKPNCSTKVPARPKTFFNQRSQSVNLARNMIAEEQYINQPCWAAVDNPCTAINKYERPFACDVYGCFASTLEYTRSFKPGLITDYFFGAAAINGPVNISGSAVANRGANDLLADYFGLPQDYQSSICFNPRVSNFIWEFDLFVGLDQWIEGAYFRVIAPFVHTNWTLDPSETVIATGTQPYPLGYMTIQQVPRSQMSKTALQFFAGDSTFGDMKTPLEFGKIAPCGKTKNAISDIHILLGWNFIQRPDAHFGVTLLGYLPTGNKPKGEYIFEPIVGNGGHFELGGGLSSHIQLWERELCNQSINLYMDLNVTHLFGTKQIRPFDFQANPLSRYMLLAEFERINLIVTNQNEIEDPEGELSNPGIFYQYAGSLTPVINVTSICADVSIQLQADFALMLEYRANDFVFDIGYNLWGRTQEKISISDEVLQDTYSVKGDSFMYGAADPSATTLGAPGNADTARALYAAGSSNSIVPLSPAQQSSATIFSGNNYLLDVNTQPLLNPGVDDPAEAETRYGANDRAHVYSPTPGVGGGGTTAEQINTSNALNFVGINGCDTDIALDISSAQAPSEVTNKIFVNFGYNWIRASCRVQPFLTGGFEVEFDARRKDLGRMSCDPRGALNQWGIWLKTGVGF